MKTTGKIFYLKRNYQHGGMLMEMMLSVALAAITIPFVARYQKNTIERARNIAVVKQMDVVRGALERCIMENRSNYLDHTGSHVFSEDDITSNPDRIECLVLSNGAEEPRGLINYGLTPEFIHDYGNDYTLRIRKSNDNTGQAVLQGIVLLKNGNINTLSTREIVNLGGGQVGFTDGDYVRGGFNAFSTEKTTYGLKNDDQGIIQTTDTTRGDSKYLWRTADSSDEDRKMLSFLNLDMHDIINLAGFSASEAHFSDRITLNPVYPFGSGESTIDTLKFTNRMNLNNTDLTGKSAVMNGNLAADSERSTLTANNDLVVFSNSSVEKLTVNCDVYKKEDVFYCNNKVDFGDSLNLPVCVNDENGDTVCMRNVKLDFYGCDVKNQLNLFQLQSAPGTGLVEYKKQALASHLRLGVGGDDSEQIMAPKENSLYYIGSKTANFNKINLNAALETQTGSVKQGLNELIKYVVSEEPNLYDPTYNTDLNYKYGAAWSYFNEGEEGVHDVGFYLKKFRYMQHVLIMKMACTTTGSTGCPGVAKIRSCINSPECRETLGNCKNTDSACAQEVVNLYGS